MSVLLIVGLSVLNISVIFALTNKVIKAIQESANMERSRLLYESEEFGALTVYQHDAILELHDGTVIVIPRMEETHGSE